MILVKLLLPTDFGASHASACARPAERVQLEDIVRTFLSGTRTLDTRGAERGRAKVARGSVGPGLLADQVDVSGRCAPLMREDVR